MKEKIVFFDLDSTLVKIEGLDFLAEKKGIDLSEVTRRAMDGQMDFGESMKLKMGLIKPSRDDMDFLAEKYKESLVDDAQAVVARLRKSKIQVGIMTGNFVEAAYPVADMLGIDRKNVHANSIRFDENGGYLGYDESNPLIQSSDGKLEVMRRIRPNYRRMVMVGDGSSDMRTKSVVDKFIGFGGVEERSSVRDGSAVYIQSPSLAPVLYEVLPAWRRGLRRLRGDALMRRARKATVIRR